MNFKEYIIINNSRLDENLIQKYRDKKDELFEELEKKDKIYRNYKRVVLAALLFAFLLGFLSAVGLLSYSAQEPVNITYMLLFSFFIPVISAFFTLLSLFLRDFTFAPFRLFSALMQRFFQKQYRIKIDKNLEKYLSIKNSLFMQLSFGIGFLFAFIGVLLIKDIVFAWSSTIIDKEHFNVLIEVIASPWSFLEHFVPSQELIELSRFFHIETLKSADAALLSSWWRFLLATTLFYMIFLRLILLVLVEFFYKKALKKAVASSFTIDLYKSSFEESSIGIVSSSEDNSLQKASQKSSLKPQQEREFEDIYAWNYNKKEAKTFIETLGCKREPKLVGGLNSFEDDLALIKSAHNKDVLLLIKSWDVPTLDFIDFLEALSKEAKLILLYFQELDESSSNDIAIWKEKIESFAFDNLKIYRKEL